MVLGEEVDVDEKSYKTLLAKPPEGIGSWPLVLIINLKIPFTEANIALRSFEICQRLAANVC